MLYQKQIPAKNGKEFITMCAGCNAVKIAAGWMPYSWASLLIDIPKITSEFRVSHGICKNCAIKLYGSEIAHIYE